ncbi:MAG: DUF115 domain-containing protein [Treponema sp.]|jgi:hypothetical protein|nr:DUF115 domain-containing protein [Treponema sp.]
MQGQPFVRNGKTLLSGIDPVRRAERTADAVSVSDRTLYFCPSVLFGYGLARLLSRLEASAPNSAVLCIEADPQLYELTLQNIDPALAVNKKLRITNLPATASADSSAADALLANAPLANAARLAAIVSEAWGTRAFRRIETIRFTGGYQLFPELYDSLCEALRRQIASDWSNALTLAKLGRLFIRNALRNISLVSVFPSVSELSFGDCPVLVLGAGPSLDDTLDSIVNSQLSLNSKRKEKIPFKPEDRPFKIVCVDTCLGALKDRGITPDLAVILESQHWNLRDFIGCRDWKANAAVDISALPLSAQILGGKGCLFFTPWTSLRIFERLKDAGLLPAAVEPLGSVGLTAVEIARCLTGGKIICSGLDFSFTADSYHARGTPGHRSKLNAHTRLRSLANTAAYSETAFAAVSKTGVRVYANPVMRNYRDLFEQEFGSDRRIFDIEGCGLSLGIKTLSMKEAMEALNVNTEEFPQRRKGAKTAEGKEINSIDDFFSCSPRHGGKNFALDAFYKSEKNRLIELRDILCGEAEMNNKRLNELIDECDYLWAHFPDRAGDFAAGSAAGRRPEIDLQTDISFLKRVRIEIDSMLELISHFV